MPKLFISYRRVDSEYVADTIYTLMGLHFGKDNVFLDVGSIPFGVDFRTYLRDQMAAHDVVLVIIGPGWAQSIHDNAGQPNDFVRLEIENALALNKLVIPVLVMNAHMPDFSDLPASIHDLQFCNAAVIRRQPDLENDCARLAEGIGQFFAAQGMVHQPRRSKSVELMPPPFAWIEIPAGRVALMPDDIDKQESYLKKNRHFEVPTFAVSKYPVTNDQYSLFVNAGGYRDQRWWTDTGWEILQKENWTQPRYWKNARFNDAEQPIIGVSWYEAAAFCQWLSETTDEPITLPTEQQWQRAAQGDDGRVYPWGEVWDGNRCNNRTDDKWIGVTTPVRQYEGKGDSPFGVADIVGNVWEWCVTDYRSNNSDMNIQAEYRVLRGGSWLNSSSGNFRCDYRYWDFPYLRVNNYGFRCTRSI